MNRRSLVVAGALSAVGLIAALAGWNQVDTQNAQVAAVAAASAVAGQATPFAVDGTHSSVVYRIKHMDVAYFYGRFNAVEGTFHLDKDNPSASTFDITIDAASIDSANDKRDEHLRNADFFNVKEFPTITFKSTSVEKTGDNTFTLKGDLTLRGQTKEIEATVEHTGTGPGRRGGEVGGMEAKFTFDRTDFGMDYMAGKGLGEKVNVIVSLEGARQ
jgi:polyisoprenoid-binding protein YceI